MLTLLLIVAALLVVIGVITFLLRRRSDPHHVFLLNNVRSLSGERVSLRVVDPQAPSDNHDDWIGDSERLRRKRVHP